jgi:hypothetical protein
MLKKRILLKFGAEGIWHQILFTILLYLQQTEYNQAAELTIKFCNFIIQQFSTEFF